jgi:ABC-2 type transport system ATP-binding protein/lipopolysaccharide transport system ATP-binding protein
MNTPADLISSDLERDTKKSHSDEFAVEINDVTVAYRAYIRRPTSLKETIISTLKGKKEPTFSSFDALSQVSMKIAKGSVFALIGSNGCGKSTLLKVIAGVLKPTKGCVKLSGDIASLIELGAGFDPDLTAIENIYLNGSLHKKTRAEMQGRIQHILDFSELHEFAFTPIKYYSSGMYARLAFSVAVDVNPKILLVDEILGVGDERFQEKCKKVFDELINKGKTIVLVTHNMDYIMEKANQVALLKKGKLVYFGEPKRAAEIYRSSDYSA